MEISRRLTGLRGPRQGAGATAASLGQRTIFYHTRVVKPCQAGRSAESNLRLARRL